MDIDLLSKMVKELILDNDRVVLPGLGSFVAEMVPSTFSDKGYTINPPYRRLFFRSKPDEGDMLVRFYAESNNVTPDLAERIIKDFISELRDVLHTKKTVVFPGLGRLRATKENNVFFVADENLDIYPAGFGLEPISLKTHEEAAKAVSAEVEGLKTMADETQDSAHGVVGIVDEELIDINIEEDIIPEGWDGTSPEPEPEAEPEPEQEQEAEPEPEAEPEQENEVYVEAESIEPASDLESVSEPVSDSEFEPAPEQVTEQETERETEKVSDPVSDQEPAIVPADKLVLEPIVPVQIIKPVSGSQKSAEPSTSNKVLKAILISLICVFALAVIYMLVMRIFPNFMNNILYTPEELEIINFK